MGAYIGTGAAVLDLQEYYAYYHSLMKFPNARRRAASWVTEDYQNSLLLHASSFASSITTERGKIWYVDSTPWNLLIVDELQRLLPGSLCILMLRGWAGVVQSLARSYNDGYEWAGANTLERLAVWADLYRHADEIKVWRTIAVNFDVLCEQPGKVLGRFHDVLAAEGLADDLDIFPFTIAHANSTGSSSTLAAYRDGQMAWRPRLGFNPALWAPEDERIATEKYGDIDAMLKTKFSDAFKEDGIAVTGES